MYRYCFLLFLPGLLTAQPGADHNLNFSQIPQRWEEALPMGNGLLGCLVWQKDGNIRLSLDRADLWDLRPMQDLDRPEFNYQWVAAQVKNGNYTTVQQYFDAPYEQEAGPTKLPGGAVEIRPGDWPLAQNQAVALDISTGLVTIQWAGGQRFETFVHAGRREGWFRCTGFPDAASCFQLIAPQYQSRQNNQNGNSVQGSDLARLGYPQSQPFQRRGVWLFHQPGWGGFSYEIAVCIRKKKGNVWEGVWTISSHFPAKIEVPRAENIVRKSIGRGFDRSFRESAKWWTRYWSKSSISIPDKLIEKQYYLDLYKFGCTARANSPMISLQAIWTADNGRLPPWKGDLHHDLNTQLSYWPAYTSNHLPEAMSYLKHLESNESAHRAYTRQFFGADGLNIPGVSTLLGAPMGGWIQYACSPTTAAWCAQHFYLQWRYSMDRKFLKEHAWPWFHDVATCLSEITYLNQSGVRLLPLSSSPEINDNSITAWFTDAWTNFDLALARFVFEKAAELARELGLSDEFRKWDNYALQLPKFAFDTDSSLLIAPGFPYRQSHRHFSNLMAIHPLGLFDWENPADRPVIVHSLEKLDAAGSGNWCGYSWAWLANLRARARDGAGARDALRIFAEAFVSKNSFHLNGDQSGKGYSGFTYDPFTLEGNFASAAGVQEMLLQSHNGLVCVFPAIPADWHDISFKNLRAEGAFLVSAQLDKQGAGAVEVRAEQGGFLRILIPGGHWIAEGRKEAVTNGYWQGFLKKGETLRLHAL